MVCGRCGYRLGPRYAGPASLPRYCCSAKQASYGGPRCQSLNAAALDDEIVRLTLLALTPSSLEVSLQVATDLEQQRNQTESLWQQRLERAAYEADRARRQYEAVEPENRLVARTVEAAWEKTLRCQREVQEQYERFCQQQPRILTAACQQQIRQLAEDLPALWNASETTDEDRKAILRQLIDRIVVNVEGETEWVEARIHWSGGHQTYTRFRRPVARMDQLSTWPELKRRLRDLKAAGHKVPDMVRELTADGFRTANGRKFTATGVRTLLARHGLSKTRCNSNNNSLAADEWYIPDLARELQVGYQTIYGWIKKGFIEARRSEDRQQRWIIKADASQRAQLTGFKQHQLQRRQHHQDTSDNAKL